MSKEINPQHSIVVRYIAVIRLTFGMNKTDTALPHP